MSKLICVLMVGLALSVSLAACAPATPAPAAATSSPSTLPPPTSNLTPEPIGIGVPVIEYLNGENELLVISSATGRIFDGLPPIPLGTYYSYAFSPDKRTLAAASVTQLYLIDLPSWKHRLSNVGLHGVVSSVVYSPDGSLLALTSQGPEGYLRIVDARNGEVQAGGPAGCSIRSARFTRDDKAIMVYCPRLASTGESIGAPRAALFAASDLRLLWSVELNGVRDGIFPKEAGTANTQDIHQPGAARYFEPGIAFDPGHDLLYLVHGDEDKLTTVDFTHRKVNTVAVHAKTSWFDQLIALTAGVAHAKGMDGTSKQAVISPDGKYLFVSGNTEAVSQKSNGNWDMTDTSIGLQVISTQDGSVVRNMDTEASSATLSPGGQQLLLTGWKEDRPWTDVYDISSMRIIQHLDDTRLIPTRRMDGKAMLASSDEISDAKSEMALVAPDTWIVMSRWTGPDPIGWLIDP